MTVAELASALKLTRNALLVPLADLEGKGLIRRSQVERTGRAGKPAQRFEIVPEEVEQSSPAYAAVAPHLLSVVVAAPAEQVSKAMFQIGLGMHADAAAFSGTTGPIGLDRALAFLRRQGAEIELRDDGGDRIVLSHSCPIGQLVRVDKCICQSISAFLQEATGAKTNSECDYADKFTCRFRLKVTQS
jgi:predicted ArsR family transcriptional regulator